MMPVASMIQATHGQAPAARMNIMLRFAFASFPSQTHFLGVKQIVEPANHRACIKCCDDPADCQSSSKGALKLSLSELYTDYNSCAAHPHCPKVIPGKYFHCA